MLLRSSADVGTLQDNSKFDSSRDRGQPFVTQIGVGRVIKGWDEGVPQLSVGQKANLICTPDYAYGSFLPDLMIGHADRRYKGARGFPPVIPANAYVDEDGGFDDADGDTGPSSSRSSYSRSTERYGNAERCDGEEEACSARSWGV